jgi:hypothetical protein
LQVVSSLVRRPAQKYLVLLHEAVPFLAELLEDTSHAVDALTQELVAQLEAIAGGSLDPYMKTSPFSCHTPIHTHTHARTQPLSSFLLSGPASVAATRAIISQDFFLRRKSRRLCACCK